MSDLEKQNRLRGRRGLGEVVGEELPEVKVAGCPFEEITFELRL